MRRRKKNNLYKVLLILLLCLGIGYAFLTTNLSINGTANVPNAAWDIHFANLVVNQESTATVDQAATIDSDTAVSYEITMSQPGEFYEFNVDVVNGGTIDGMIESITSKMNNTSITTLPNYLEYSITYDDGVALAPNQLLNAGDTETYKIRVGYKRDITPEDIPTTDQTLHFTFDVTYVQADENAIERPLSVYNTIISNAVMDNIKSTYVTGNGGVSFYSLSSDTNGKGIYIRAGTENDMYPIYYFRGSVANNNIIFANHCWKIVRTTDTGGIKLIYNGVPSNGVCNNNLNNSSLPTTTLFNSNLQNLATVSYMYGTVYYSLEMSPTTPYLYGNSFTYQNNTYTLVDTITSSGTWSNDYNTLNNNHYTCMNTTGTCSSIYYIYRTDQYRGRYITLTGGKGVEDALSEMLTNSANTTNSTIKTIIDEWYEQNILPSYSSYLEDTVFCNDRSIYQLYGWDPNGGSNADNLQFGPYGRGYQIPILTCPNRNDAFTVSSSIGNGALTYPIGMLTLDEFKLAGDKITSNTAYDIYYLYTGSAYWTMSPRQYIDQYFSGFYIKTDGHLTDTYINTYCGIRPSISLKHNTIIAGGDGTRNNPYTIEP